MTQQFGGPPPAAGTAWPPPVPQPTPTQGTATPPPAPSAPPRLPLGLTPPDGYAALRIAGFALLPVLAALTVLVAVLAGAVLPDPYQGSLADWLRTAVLLLVLALGGSGVLDGSVGAAHVSGSLSVTVHLIPLVATAAVLGLVVRASGRYERRAPSADWQQLLGRAGVTGLVAGLGLTVAALLATTSEPYGLDLQRSIRGVEAGVDVGPGALGAFVGGTLLVGLAAAFGRARVAPAGTIPLPAWASRYRTADVAAVLRTLATFAVGLLGAAGVALLLGFLYEAAFTDDLDGHRFPGFVTLLVLGLNGALALALAALGVPAGMSDHSSGRGSVLGIFRHVLPTADGHSASFSLFTHPVALLVLLVPVVVALGTAARRALRDPAAVIDARSLKVAAGCGAVAAFAAALVLRVTYGAAVGGSVEDVVDVAGSAGSDLGFALLWAPLLGACWAVLVVWLLRAGPTVALSLPPRATRLIAGRDVRPEWAAALAGTAPAPAGHRSRGLRLTGVVAGALLVLAGIGAAVVAILNSAVFTPQAAAQAYLHAVAGRDVRGAVEQMATQPKADRTQLLGADVLRSGDFAPIRDIRIGEVREGDSSATVSVSYLVGDERRQDTVSLTTGPKRMGLFDTWRVAGGLPTVTVERGELAATIGGHTLAPATYVALPGRYTLHPADNPMFGAADVTAAVTLGGHADVAFEPGIKPALLQQAEAAVRARIQDCTQATQVPLENCPFLSRWGSTTPQNVQLQISTQPTFELRYTGTPGRLTIDTDSMGTVEVTGEYASDGYMTFDTPQPFEYSQRFNLNGTVTLSNGKAQVNFDQ